MKTGKLLNVIKRIGNETSEGGNSHKGLGKHVPARIMGQFAIFCSGYGCGSCFVNLALVMGQLYRDLP